MNNIAFKNPSDSVYIFILSALMITGSASTDMYVPSLPFIAQYFHVGADSVKWSMTLYLFGFITSQLVYGPLSDRYGRRTVLLTALAIALVGSILCITADSIYMLWLGRFIQGAGVSTTIARAIAQDTFSGAKLSQTVATLSVIYGFAPIIAPLVGGYLQQYLQWRGVFLFIFIYLILLTALVWKLLPETNDTPEKELGWHKLVQHYRNALTNQTFITNAICASAAMAGIISYYTLSPFLLQQTLKLSSIEYGFVIVAVASGMLIGKSLNTRLLKYFPIHQLIFMGTISMLFGSSMMLLFALLGYLNVTCLVGPFIFFTIGTGLVFANALVAAFKTLHSMGGIAGAAYTCIQVGGSFGVSILVAHLPQANQLPLALLLTGLAAGAFLLNFYHLHKQKLLFA